jgi:DNA-binding winged helix-turn-helix (wHTH) protein/tetratricopeptide (TPR) repeat protein
LARDDQPIRLADEPPFSLQGLAVTPATRQAAWAQEVRTLEPRVMQVLVALSRAHGAVVARDELIQRCWDGRAVGDNAINRVISMLRQLGAETGAFSLVTVTKVGYRLVESVARDAESRPVAGVRRWRLRAGAVALMAAVAALTWWGLERTGGLGGHQNGRVEIARVEARQRDPELVRLAAQVGDSLVQALTRSGIDTAPEREDGGKQGAAELRVTASVDRQGQDLVINTQVLDRKSSLVLSSLQVVRPAISVRGAADQAALGVAAGLACALSDRKQSRRSMSPSIFSLYLNTCDAVAREGNPQRMLQSAGRLVAAAPKLAAAHALYGIAQANAAGAMTYAPAEADILRRGARQSAARALQLDPQTAKAYVAIANSYSSGGDWIERERNFVKAREIDPELNPGRISHVFLLREVGRLKEALEMIERVMASGDPRTLSNAMVPAIFIKAELGDMEGALVLLAELERSDPDRARGAAWMVASSWEARDAALAHLHALGSRGGAYSPRTFACVETVLRELPQRQARRARGLPSVCDDAPGERRLQLMAREGDLDGAYAEASTAFAGPSSGDVGVLFFPTLKAFRADPRFMPLTKRLGLLDYWSRSGKWPDFCSEPDLPYDCRQSAGRLAASPSPTPPGSS